MMWLHWLGLAFLFLLVAVVCGISWLAVVAER